MLRQNNFLLKTVARSSIFFLFTTLSGVSIQHNARNVSDVRNVTKGRRYWIGQSQPPATTAYAAGTLPSCGRHTIKYEIIEIKFDLHHKLHNK